MRTLMVVSDFLPGKLSGVEQYVFELSSALREQEHDVQVLFSRPVYGTAEPLAPRNGLYQELPTIQLPIPSEELEKLNNPRVRFMVRQVLRRTRPDIVHIHGLQNLSFAVLDAAYQCAVPTMYTAHDFSFLCAKSILQDAFGKVCSGPESPEKCAKCVLLTQRLQQLPEMNVPLETMRKRAQLSQKHFSLLRMVSYPSDFSRNKHHAFGLHAMRETRSELGMRLPAAAQPARRPGRTVRFTYLGGICHVKGLDIAVKAFNKANTKHAVLQLYGSVNNPLYFNSVRSLIKPEKRITYFGRFSKANLRLIFSQTDFLVLPSRMETFSFVAREALAHGVPVIAAQSGALPEIIFHGHNGLLFDPARPDELADIFSLLSEDPNLLYALRKGIGYIRDIENDARETAAIYATLSSSGKNTRTQRQFATYPLG